MKSTIFVEYQNKQVEEKSLVLKVKELWVNEGNKIKDIESLNLYVKPEDDSVYFVINDTYKGHFSVE